MEKDNCLIKIKKRIKEYIDRLTKRLILTKT